MQTWAHRAVEEANLFNPAFCGAILARTSENFAKKAGRELPFALAFLVLPIVLHRATREALPASTITSLLPWIQENKQLIVDFPVRAQRLRDISREAILFGVQHETLAVTPDGALSLGAKHRSPTERRTPLFTAEARECMERAAFLGRWLAAAGSTASIFAAWGVAP